MAHELKFVLFIEMENAMKIMISYDTNIKQNNLRINLRHGKLKVAGNEKSPLKTAERSAGTVGARNGIFPITIKYNKTPELQMSTGPPTYESSLNTTDSIG